EGACPPGTVLNTRGCSTWFVTDTAVMEGALALLNERGLVELSTADRARVVTAPPRRLPQPAPSIPADIRVPGLKERKDLLCTVREQWRRRTPVPEEVLTAQWHRMRALALVLKDAQHDGMRAERAAQRLVVLSARPLPAAGWMRPWHLAVLQVRPRHREPPTWPSAPPPTSGSPW
ncbi:hypothetical protein ACWEV4_33005, partial [Streptomyces sp. NPDC003860]